MSAAALVGDHPSIVGIRRLVRAYGRTAAPVLIRGETGVGKELVARMVHQSSRRGDGPFVGLNCAQLTPDLASAELMGHVHGAFTGAVGANKGLARAANGGTLFLDELGDLCREGQVALLRLVQEGEVRPVGSTRMETVDVRFVSATHKLQSSDRSTNGFREDLFHRLGVLVIEVPPLRHRASDIPAIARALLRRQGSKAVLDKTAEGWLMSREWPGNIRQLQNVLQRVCAIHHLDTHLTREHLESTSGIPSPVRFDTSIRPRDAVRLRRAWDMVRTQPRISQSELARRLGVARSTWLSTLKRTGFRLEDLASLKQPPD